MHFDLRGADAAHAYKLLAGVVVPRPIAWVVTQDAAGGVNAAPFSFFNVLSGDPPIVAVGIGSRLDTSAKDTGSNIVARGEFVINLVSESLAEAMNITAIDFPPGVSELGEAGLATAPSISIDTPRIAQSPVALECKLWQTIEVDNGRSIYLGRVQSVYLDDMAILDPDRRHIDAAKLKLVGRMHGAGWYTRTTDLFNMMRLTLDEWRKR